MQTRIKTILLISLILFAVAVMTFFYYSISNIENDAYLTPIPYETISAYRIEYPIDSRFEAVIVAHREYFTGSRLEFTQGFPKVTSVEKMNLSDAVNLLGFTEHRSGSIDVWLLVFEGQWQILPPMSSELSPIETGCIYIVFDAENSGYGYFSARDCISQK